MARVSAGYDPEERHKPTPDELLYNVGTAVAGRLFRIVGVSGLLPRKGATSGVERGRSATLDPSISRRRDCDNH
jgi:hypothetical protein